MRNLALAASASLVLVGGTVQAQTPPTTEAYTRVRRTYTADNVLSVLGANTPVRPPVGQQATFASLHAGVHTDISCGQLRFGLDFDAMKERVTAMADQLKGQLGAAVGALPLLILCQSSPSLCAEIKNFNYQLNEELKGLMDVCRSMDDYIDGKAKEGQATAWRQCIDEKLQEHPPKSMTTAQLECNRESRHPVFPKIDSALHAIETTDAPQEVLKSLLTATGHDVQRGLGEERYHFLSAVLGEFTLDVNGKLVPLFPVQPTTVTDLARSVGIEGVRRTCDTARLRRIIDAQHPEPDPTDGDGSVRTWKKEMNEVIRRNVTLVNTTNLDTLDDSDRAVACSALGKSLAQETLRQLGAQAQSIMAQLTGNPNLPADVRRDLESRSDTVAKALQGTRFDGSNYDLRRVLEIIQTMAADTQERRRQDAAAAAKGQLRWEEGRKRMNECTAEYDCGR
jgi:hypothetical protein